MPLDSNIYFYVKVKRRLTMYYINATPNTTGNYGNPQGQLFPNCIKLPDELLSDYLAYNGFVNLTTEGDTLTAVEPNT